ncbi:MAG: hypothetical protein ACE5OZ_22430 [Candidatus Heimdallarchaeota archaeon]
MEGKIIYQVEKIRGRLNNLRQLILDLIRKTKYTPAYEKRAMEYINSLHLEFRRLKKIYEPTLSYDDLPIVFHKNWYNDFAKNFFNIDSKSEFNERDYYQFQIDELRITAWDQIKIGLRKAEYCIKVLFDDIETLSQPKSSPLKPKPLDEIPNKEIDSEERKHTIGGWFGLPQTEVTDRERNVFIYGFISGLFACLVILSALAAIIAVFG